MKQYTLETNVWVYPGDVAWHFISINKKLSAEIKDKYGKRRRGFGSLPVDVTIGETSWQTSIFPTKEGEYLLPIKAQVRKKEGIQSGDTVALAFKIVSHTGT